MFHFAGDFFFIILSSIFIPLSREWWTYLHISLSPKSLNNTSKSYSAVGCYLLDKKIVSRRMLYSVTCFYCQKNNFLELFLEIVKKMSPFEIITLQAQLFFNAEKFLKIASFFPVFSQFQKLKKVF